ncbi:hypothetical protein [uncultured Maritimibacter sp.]|uniref:GumC family protein n=1 Tax=uncultured Maritimibacter sp. TaxID=991866 RepID=UPI0025952C8B|nr:hypothetical protein [uncultured Maritimibacter sp.]
MFARPREFSTVLRHLRPIRTPIGKASIGRVLVGGRIDDAGRLPRYIGITLLATSLIWAPILGYLATATARYTSQAVLILPGSGASASVTLDSIGQASSHASSPFANNSVSPTVTYKRLIGADRIIAHAAETVGTSRADFGSPQVQLIDQTGMIQLSITAGSPIAAQERGDALIAAFFEELDALRADELGTRETSGEGAIEEFRASVAATRAEMEALQRETGLVSAGQYEQIVSETDALRRRVLDLETDLDEQTRQVDALVASLAISPTLAAATIKLHADSEFAALADQMAEQSAALAMAAQQYGANHPERVGIRTKYEATLAEARRRAGRITGLGADQLDALDLAPVGGRADLLARLVEYDAARQGLAAEHATLATQLAVDEAKTAALLEPAARLEDLQRNFQVAEAVFASAMARAQTTKSDLYASYPLVQVLEDPNLPDQPSSPRKKLALAAGIAATLMLFMGLALGWMRRPLINRLLAKPAP